MNQSDITLESKALSLLENYEGGNNYLLELKRKSQVNRKFYPTRSQSEYIINNHDKQPKVAKKWVVLDGYVRSDNKHTYGGYKPFYRTITCAPAQETEFRGV